VSVLANTTEVQAVRNEQLGITEMIFYSPGYLQLPNGLSVAVDQPSMLLLEEVGSAPKLSASAPRGPLALHVSLEKSGQTKTITFDLRGGPSLGASYVKPM
jgi:chondroitin AC lyase